MKKIILAFLIVFLACTAHAVDYYIDATGGNDENDGQSPVLAWKTIGQVNSINFQPGDTVRFKCGEVWREQLNVSGSGSVSSPITYMSYGDSCNNENKPVINAAAEINAVWSQYSGNIYAADVDLTTTPRNYIANSSFDIDVSKWFEVPRNTSDGDDAVLALEPVCIIGKGGCLKYTSSLSGSDNHFNNTDEFHMNTDESYVIKFKMAAEEEIQVRVRIWGRPYEPGNLAYDKTITVGTDVLDYEEEFIPASTIYTDKTRKVLFYVPVGQKVLYVDDVSVTPTTGEPAVAKQLFVNRQHLKLAQYPDTGYSYMDEDSIPGGGTGYGYGTDFLIDYELSAIAGQDLTGAGIHIRSCDWAIEDRVVHTFDTAATKLIWTDDTSYSILSGYGYYVDNKLWMLDSEGEWFYDDINRKMYVWLPGDEDPNNAGFKIEASIYDYGMRSVLRSNITIEGLEIKNAALDGLHFTDSPNAQVMNVSVSDSGSHGMYFLNSDAGRIEDSIVRNSVNEGIFTKQSTGLFILRNLIENSGVVGSPRYSYGAITASDYSQIMNNTILNSGYIGIGFRRESIIKNNVLKNSCLVLNDCGAIYTWNGNDNPYNPTPYNSEVSGNIVIGSQGGLDGTPKTSTRARGIYLDGGSDGITVLNNTVTGAANDGIYFRASNALIDGNTIYGNGGAQITMIESMIVDDVPINTSKDNIVEHNIFFPTGPYERSLAALSVSYDFYDPAQNYYYGAFDYNTYSTMYSDIAVYEKYKPDNEYTTALYYLHLWQQVQTYRDGIPGFQDTNSTLFEPFNILPYKILSIDSGNFIVNGSFDTNYSRWFKGPDNYGDVEFSFEPDGVIGNGGCLKYTSSANPSNDNHFNNVDLFPLYTDKHYNLKFKIAAEEGLEIQVVIMESPYSPADWAYKKWFTIGSTVLNHSEVFVPLNNVYNAKILFYIYGTQKTVFVDDVSVEEVTAEFNDPADDSNILVNDTDQDNEEFACPDMQGDVRCSQYIDLNGETVTWPVSMNKYSSRIIVWGANPFRDIDHDHVPDPCEDGDGDGYSSEGGMCGDVDCDDNNASVNQNASEICDGNDNNCDGVIDEGFDIDSDGDGILDDGDGSCTVGDNLCTGGNTENCDDNCPNTYNPGQLNNEYFDLKKAKVLWSDTAGLTKVKVSGELALSCGDYYNLNPVGSAKIGISGVPELVSESVSFTVNGNEGKKWKYKKDEVTSGINKFKIDWQGAKFKYNQDIRIESVHIGYETATIEIDRKAVTDAVSVEVNGVTVNIDETGTVAVQPSTIEFDVDEDGEIEVDLPFTLTQDMVFTVNQGSGPAMNTYTVVIGDYYTFAVGKYKVKAYFDQGTLNGDSTPATLDLEMTVGDQGFVKRYQITDSDWKNLNVQKWKYKESK